MGGGIFPPMSTTLHVPPTCRRSLCPRHRLPRPESHVAPEDSVPSSGSARCSSHPRFTCVDVNTRAREREERCGGRREGALPPGALAHTWAPARLLLSWAPESTFCPRRTRPERGSWAKGGAWWEPGRHQSTGSRHRGGYRGDWGNTQAQPSRGRCSPWGDQAGPNDRGSEVGRRRCA